MFSDPKRCGRVHSEYHMGEIYRPQKLIRGPPEIKLKEWRPSTQLDPYQHPHPWTTDIKLLTNPPRWGHSISGHKLTVSPFVWQSNKAILSYFMEKEMATHSSTVAWKISGTEEPGGLKSMGSQRVGHDWATSFSLSLPISPQTLRLDSAPVHGGQASASVWLVL